MTVNILDISSGLLMSKDQSPGLISFEQTSIYKAVNDQDLSSGLLMSKD